MARRSEGESEWSRFVTIGIDTSLALASRGVYPHGGTFRCSTAVDAVV
jgi:hypothetical protein